MTEKTVIVKQEVLDSLGSTILSLKQQVIQLENQLKELKGGN